MTTNKVCVIGDPDQAIYGFRGASRDFFINFTNDFPLAKSIRLKQNYRSAQNILAASVQMLKKDKVGIFRKSMVKYRTGYKNIYSTGCQ